VSYFYLRHREAEHAVRVDRRHLAQQDYGQHDIELSTWSGIFVLRAASRAVAMSKLVPSDSRRPRPTATEGSARAGC
jgi:hypothetical protein